ncbi:MAG TPA: DUF1622 domain-containing protein [Polyangia bacterium]
MIALAEISGLSKASSCPFHTDHLVRSQGNTIDALKREHPDICTVAHRTSAWTRQSTGRMIMVPAAMHALIERVASWFEVIGMTVMVVGALLAFVPRPAASWRPRDLVQGYRERLGRAIVLGLEFLVAADILQTISTEPTLRSVGTLGLIVLIRTFLSFSLEVELEGRWPWRQRPAEKEPPDVRRQ